MPKRYLVLILGVIGCVFVGVGVFLLVRPRKAEIEVLGSDTQAEVATEDIVVDITGAVNRPGVYRFAYGKRIVDAIEAAGGIREDADRVWIEKKLNKSEKLKDGVKLYIPVQGTEDIHTTSRLVSINDSTSAQLESLPGIGKTTAEKIVSGRPYSRIEELVEKKIVGQKVFDQIKDILGI